MYLICQRASNVTFSLPVGRGGPLGSDYHRGSAYPAPPRTPTEPATSRQARALRNRLGAFPASSDAMSHWGGTGPGRAQRLRRVYVPDHNESAPVPARPRCRDPARLTIRGSRSPDHLSRMMASFGAAPAPPASRQVRCRCGPAKDTLAVGFSSAAMAPLHVQMTRARFAPLERPPSAKTSGQSRPRRQLQARQTHRGHDGTVNLTQSR